MKKPRIELEELVILISKEINSQRKLIDSVCEFTSEKNMTRGKTLSILNQNNPVELITDEELCLITNGLFNATKNDKINPTRFYTEEEIVRAELYFKSKRKSNNKAIFKNVFFDPADGMYKCAMFPDTDTAELWGNGLLTYDKETQRPSKKIIRRGNVIEKADVNQTSVNDVASLLIKDDFFSNLLTLRIKVIDRDLADINYNENTHTLEITVDGENVQITVPDGFHRISAIAKAVRENPNTNHTMFLRILDCDTATTLKCIEQETHHNDIDPKVAKRYGTKSKETELVKLINNDSSETTNAMYKRLADDMKQVDYGDKYTTYETITNTLEILKSDFGFELDYTDQREIRKFKEFLIEGYGEILSIYKNEFKNKKDSNKENFICHSNMFILYTSLLVSLKNKENWHDQLENILNNIDFSKKNKFWNEITFKTKVINKVLVKKIINFVNEIVNKGAESNEFAI